MKKLLLIAILVTCVFAIIYFSLESKNKQELPITNSQPREVSILDSGIVNSNTNFRAFVTIKSLNNSNVTLDFLWLANKPSKEVYFLDYPTVQREIYAKTADELKVKLKQNDFTVKSIEVDDIDLLNETILIIPTGIFPAKLASNNSLERFLNNSNILIYIGLPMETFLNRDGTQTQVANNDLASKIQQKAALYASTKDSTTIKAKGHAVFITNITSYSKKASSDIFEVIVYNSWEKPFGKSTITLDQNGDLTQTIFTTEAKTNTGFGRILIKTNNEIKPLDFGEFKKPTGSLIGHSDYLQNETANFLLTLTENYTTTKEFHPIITITQNGEIKDKLRLDYIYVKNVWQSNLNYNPTLGPGDYMITLYDQDNEKHARAYMHIQNLSISLLNVETFHYTFEVRVDNNLLQDARVLVSIDNSSNNKQLITNNGKFTVGADIPNGFHIFKISIMDKTVQVPYVKNGTSLLNFYLTYGSAALVASATLYFILKRPSKITYKLLIPYFAEEFTRNIMISSEEFTILLTGISKTLNLENLPLAFNEIKLGLRTVKLNGLNGVILTDSNLTEILEKLKEKNVLCSYNDYYFPARQLTHSSLETLILKRFVIGKLIEKGLEHEVKNNSIEVTSQELVSIYLYNNSSTTFSQIKYKDRNLIVFLSEDDLLDFKARLIDTSGNAIRLLLELKYGKLYLTTANNLLNFI